jgi:hypothetical protein
LVKPGATGVMYEYEQGTGRIQALRFMLVINDRPVAFSLPVEWRRFQEVLRLQRVSRWRDEDYVYRVSWRNIRDWVMAQLALYQVLRSASQPLQGRKHIGATAETERALELVDTELALMPFPLQDTEGDYTAGDVMQLRPLGACLTAGQAELVLTNPNDLRDLGPEAIEPPYLSRGQHEAVEPKQLWH